MSRSRRLAEHHIGRRRRVDRELVRQPRDHGRFGFAIPAIPSEPLPLQRFTITPEIAFGQPGDMCDPSRYAVHLPRETPAEFVPPPIRDEDAA